jgi:hypothetical protein
MRNKNLIFHFFGTLIGFVTTGVILTCCSGINIGSSGSNFSPNDVRPTSLPMVQGFFVSQNSQTVSGTALIFNVTGLSYVLRLEGITTPSETGLQIQLYGSDGQQNFSLRANSGSQNYTFTSTNPAAHFSSVSIYSTLSLMPYGSAQLK